MSWSYPGIEFWRSWRFIVYRCLQMFTVEILPGIWDWPLAIICYYPIAIEYEELQSQDPTQTTDDSTSRSSKLRKCLGGAPRRGRITSIGISQCWWLWNTEVPAILIILLDHCLAYSRSLSRILEWIIWGFPWSWGYPSPPDKTLEYLGGVRQENFEKYSAWPRGICPSHVFFGLLKDVGGGASGC